MNQIILSADSTCDLDHALKEKYKVNIQALNINLGENQYKDGIDIKPDDIYRLYEEKGQLPKTAAPNIDEYIKHFKKLANDGNKVIHISLGSALSSSYQNACLAADEVDGVYIVDSCNLSTGMGLLVLETAEVINEGWEIEKILTYINNLKSKVSASFIIDKLTYLREGGRCSPLVEFGANVLNIKPCIKVNNLDGSMDVGKKYRGRLNKVLKEYSKDIFSEVNNIKLNRIFITHSGVCQENIDLVKNIIEENYNFKEILITRAGCTISSHCGPNTLGILFVKT